MVLGFQVAVLWFHGKAVSRPQETTVGLSTCEAEYMSPAAAVQQAKFPFQPLDSILDASRNTFVFVTLYCDNPSYVMGLMEITLLLLS